MIPVRKCGNFPCFSLPQHDFADRLGFDEPEREYDDANVAPGRFSKVCMLCAIVLAFFTFCSCVFVDLCRHLTKKSRADKQHVAILDAVTQPPWPVLRCALVCDGLGRFR